MSQEQKLEPKRFERRLYEVMQSFIDLPGDRLGTDLRIRLPCGLNHFRRKVYASDARPNLGKLASNIAWSRAYIEYVTIGLNLSCTD